MHALDIFNLTDEMIGPFFRFHSTQRHPSVLSTDVDRFRVADETGKVDANPAFEDSIIDDFVGETCSGFDDGASRAVAKVTRFRAESCPHLFDFVGSVGDLITQQRAAPASPVRVEQEHRRGAEKNSENETFIPVHVHLPILLNPAVAERHPWSVSESRTDGSGPRPLACDAVRRGASFNPLPGCCDDKSASLSCSWSWLRGAGGLGLKLSEIFGSAAWLMTPP